MIERVPPIWIVGLSGEDAPDDVELLERTDPSLFSCVFRGVGLGRLKTVQSSGIDVEPSDSVIFAELFEKAWEYGGMPKVFLALDATKLKRTFVEVASTISPQELESLRAVFPTMLTSRDGTSIWLSKLREDDPRLATNYETEYARWIQGDPRNALKAVFIFSRQEDDEIVNAALSNSG
jgi:hypothetical protein